MKTLMSYCAEAIHFGLLPLFYIFRKGGSRYPGGQRGSALCLVGFQRWEAVFRRERKPESFDRIFTKREEISQTERKH